MTHSDAYPLPRIDATLDPLAGSRYFTLDLASGYLQVEIEEGDKEKTAFLTRKGHFEFNVMPFGLTNAFQRLIECILARLDAEQWLIYIDDIIVFSFSVVEHLQQLDRVLSRTRAAGLKLWTEKCHFLCQVQHLRHVVSADNVEPDQFKVQAANNSSNFFG